MAAFVNKQWATSVAEELSEVTAAGSDDVECSVHRVPPYLRDLRPDRFDCLILPMGPYNRIFEMVSPVDKLKLKLVKAFMKQVNLQGPDGWKTFRAEVAKAPPDAPPLESFYHDPPSNSYFTPEGVQLQSVVTIDAVFITAFYLRLYFEFQDGALCEEVERIFHKGRGLFTSGAIRSDIWTFENQIPLFLIKNVLRMLTNKPAHYHFDDFFRALVSDLLVAYGLPFAESGISEVTFESCGHLLGCLYKVISLQAGNNTTREAGCFKDYVCIPINMLLYAWSIALKPFVYVRKLLHSSQRQRNYVLEPWRTPPQKQPPSTVWPATSVRWRSLPTVSQLRRAGIGVKGIRTSASNMRFVPSLFNLEATLYIPKLSFYDSSDRILLNLCAYEHMTQDRQTFIAYLHIMNELINTEEDVQLLRKGSDAVIADHYLGDDKMVADMVNRLLQNVPVHSWDYYHLIGVTDKVHSWYDAQWRHQLTHFLQRFVTAPWIFITLLAATLLLIATILQTVYTIMSFYHGSNR